MTILRAGAASYGVTVPSHKGLFRLMKPPTHYVTFQLAGTAPQRVRSCLANYATVPLNDAAFHSSLVLLPTSQWRDSDIVATCVAMPRLRTAREVSCSHHHEWQSEKKSALFIALFIAWDAAL